MAELTGELGFDTDDWSLREMLWAVDAKRRRYWDDVSLALAWVINRMPRFSASVRSLHPDHINPYRRARRGIPLRGEAGERMLDAMSVDETNGSQP